MSTDTRPVNPTELVYLTNSIAAHEGRQHLENELRWLMTLHPLVDGDAKNAVELRFAERTARIIRLHEVSAA